MLKEYDQELTGSIQNRETKIDAEVLAGLPGTKGAKKEEEEITGSAPARAFVQFEQEMAELRSEILLSKSKNAYDGRYSDNAKNGMGDFRYPNGDFYRGNWVNDKRDGMGTCLYADGGAYRGYWR